MFKRLYLDDGTCVCVVVRESTAQRLRQTCFRPGDQPRAGNFRHWRQMYSVLDDRIVMDALCNVLAKEIIEYEGEVVEASVQIRHDEVVGWASTSSINGFVAHQLRDFAPNSHTRALVINPKRRDIRAPQTKLVTIVYEFKYEEDNGWVAVIHSIYPGPDIGELDGDITEREGVVFFTWEHPGETLSPDVS